MELKSKIYCMAQRNNTLVVGLSGCFVEHYDLRNCHKCISSEKIGMLHRNIKTGMLKDIDIFPNGRGYVASLMEGRCAVHHFDEDQKN